MSDLPDRDALAAEYALGCLEGAELLEAERRLAADPEFAEAVKAWEGRLAPLADLVDPVAPPPEVWQRLEALVGVVVPLRRVRVWQAATFASLAVAASLAAYIVLRPPERPVVAVLAPVSGGVPVMLASDVGGTLLVSASGSITVPDNRDLELWALAKGETRPHSLGVLPPGGRKVVASLSADTQLMVSLEPRGGSPTGQPTGPVLYAGRLGRVD